MTLEAGKEMDRKCVWDWLNKVYIAPSLSYSEYTDEEIRIFAHDALVLLKEQEAVVRYKDCKHGFRLDDTNYIVCGRPFASNRETHTDDWYCADGERRDSP